MVNGKQDTGSARIKRRRVTQACDYCHQRSIRCRATADGQGCQNCKDFAQECTYLRKPRRRGVQPRSDELARSDAGVVQIPLRSAEETRSTQWRAPEIASQATIMDLVELYFEVVYPIFPFFHQPSFIRSISRAEYKEKQSLFATTMAVCALVSSRIRDGSLTNPRWNLQSLLETDPDVFYGEAKRQLVNEMASSDFNIVRAHAVLAIAAIQNGKIRDMHQHLGMYHTLVAMDALHDEANWPRGIGVIEREERRRLFWSIYTLDIYSAVVWGGVIRSREQQSNVAYPIEVDDEFIDDRMTQPEMTETSGISPSLGRTVTSDRWMSGWNFITDLYRVLEHVLARFRGRQCRGRRGSFLNEIFEDQPAVTQASVRESVLQMYLDLPPCFKETSQMTYNVKEDRFGFQAANITASVQLLRIVLLAAGGASIEERCQIASQVVDAFVSIPVAYLLAISTPLLHHLGSIGAILGSIFEEPLSEADYNHVRSVMLSMAQLLENLEGMHKGKSASEKLRSQVARVDEYMATQRQNTLVQEEPVMSGGQALELVMQPGLESAEAPEQIDPGIPGSWMFQVPPDLLGDLTWTFDFG